MKKLLSILTLLICNLLPLGMPYAQQVKIDHVVWAVPNLDSAVNHYLNEGYTIKPGRLHSNGLLNAHIKFANGTSVELMTVAGEPKDEEALEYQQIINNGGGGAFLALCGIDFSELKECLNELQYEYILAEAKLWSYISFPPNSGLEHLFFIHSENIYIDPTKITTHKNGSRHINKVFIEGTEKAIRLFDKLGLSTQRTSDGPTEFITSTGNICLLKKSTLKERPKITKVELGGNADKPIYQLR